jgi:hypothetical protein
VYSKEDATPKKRVSISEDNNEWQSEKNELLTEKERMRLEIEMLKKQLLVTGYLLFN